jgi:hypothetical protein
MIFRETATRCTGDTSRSRHFVLALRHIPSTGPLSRTGGYAAGKRA